MSLTKLSDLLPIDPSLSKPNAYQVFGIQAGEQDMRRVKAGMRQTYQRLKETRSSAEPNVWNQALKIAEAARQVLEDPDRKRSLDVAIESAKSKTLRPPPIPQSSVNPSSGSLPSHNPPTAQTAVDPLADLLPKSNPVADRTGGSSDSATPSPPNQAAAVLGMPPLGTPPPGPSASPATPSPGVSPASAPLPANAPSPSPAGGANLNSAPQFGTPETSVSPQESPGAAPVTWTPPKPKPKKRRRKSSGMFVLGSFVVIMLAAIVYLLTMFTNNKRIQVTQANDGGIVVSQPAPDADRRDPRSRTRATPNDGVLGGAASSGVADSIRRNNPSVRLDQPGSMYPSGMDSMASDNGNSPDDMATPSSMTPDSQPPGMTAMQASETPDASEPEEPSAEEMEAMSADIKRLEGLIKSADWKQMKPTADQLLKQNLPGKLGERVSTLYDMADLASYYRGGIERGLASRETGNTFEVVEGLPVIVVEATPQSIAIQFNKRTKEYTLDQLPPRLMEKLASFALQPEQPDVQAALALYRLIHPATNQGYREDAWQMLQSVDGKLQNVDTTKLITVAKEVLGGDSSAAN
ncbi:hypothetical protein [Roseiconus lacunae]|uniref:hypothetical protein n=1 Tax=Roseiconus lacunae TaxID=2605694 RepID=UPI0011F3DF7C|nr:hypothetical protein [Roseiconus lacunae]